eukprot:TRINITY_DN27692_c0_g1_i1.p1 TRINITY_DN27692_c0_g1~~TRINITY_DN27692_c0_g1_i1.p1  ORF type:complete len:398 (+),score=92.47 TRINITY_DN27692_c0_g1_i1:100-1194(+)
MANACDRLMRAVVCCDEDEALEAVSSGAGIGRKERETGYTALHYACQYGMVRLAKALLDEGALIQAQTRDLILQNAVVQPGGQTPLHLAARGDEEDVIDLLLSRRADPGIEDVDGFTPAAAALFLKHKSSADKLADAAGQELQSIAELEALASKAVESGRRRAAQQLEVPDHLRQVYTLEKVWSLEECNRVLTAVGEAVAQRAESSSLNEGWSTDRHAAYATTDLPCSKVPAVDTWVRASVRERIFPKLAARHGWLPDDGSRLVFRDLFFVRYSAAPGAQAGLALHRDGSIISFNILLNDPKDFDSGGTYVEADDHVYQIGQGDCFVHSGKLRHGGQPVTRGERLVLVAFVDVLDEDEIAEDRA